MSTALRKRVASAFILFVAVWPLVHYGLCRTFDINPWKFNGFAMYTVPVRQIELVYVGIGNGREERIEPFEHPALAKEAKRFQQGVWTLGRLYPPHLLANMIFDEFPQYDEVLVVTGVYRINRETKLMDLDQRHYRYTRPGRDAAHPEE